MRTSVKLGELPLIDELYLEFNETKADFSQITVGSHKKLWWKCSDNKDHAAWLTSVRIRANGAGCPTCAGKVVEFKKSLETTHPLFAKQLDYTNAVKASEITAGSNKIYVWSNDTCGHTWKQTVYGRTTQNIECPVCQGGVIIFGVNSLFDKNPELKEFWGPNNTLDFTKMSTGSHKEAEWLCSEGHHYREKIIVRIKRKTCPICAGRILQKNVNDLETIKPQVAASWSESNKTSAKEIVFNAKISAEWVETCGHVYSAPIKMRVKHNACLVCNGTLIIRGLNDLATTNNILVESWSANNVKFPHEVSAGSAYRAEWQCLKGHNWEAFVYSRTRGSGCPQCNASNFISKAEQELFTIVTILANGKRVEQSNRNLLDGQELDILIPDLKLAIEFNGLYWHNENSGKDNNYHQNKMLKTKTAGFRLIQIWEDEWSRRKAIVIRALASKMKADTSVLSEALTFIGVRQSEVSNITAKVGGRECAVIEATYQEAKTFLDTNHIQGSAKGTIYVALKDKNGNLRALMVSLKRNSKWEIIRYATCGYIPGGFTKLISYMNKNFEVKTWIAFSDNAISEGCMYKNNGFIKDGDISPDYKYIINGERVHKFNYRIKKFRNDPNLKYIEGYSESQLAKLNNIPRLWDAGKIRWIKTLENSFDVKQRDNNSL